MKFEVINKAQALDTTQFGPLFDIIQNAGGVIAGGCVMKALLKIENKSDIDVFVTIFQMLEIFRYGVDLIDMKKVEGIILILIN